MPLCCPPWTAGGKPALASLLFLYHRIHNCTLRSTLVTRCKLGGEGISISPLLARAHNTSVPTQPSKLSFIFLPQTSIELLSRSLPCLLSIAQAISNTDRSSDIKTDQWGHHNARTKPRSFPTHKIPAL